MKTGAMQGPISNRAVLQFSPLEKIANLLDFECPDFVATLLDILESNDKETLKEKYDLTLAEGEIDLHLIEYFWTIARKQYIYDLMFFFDYRLYINFFLQYPMITGKNMDKNLTFTDILKEYRKMDIIGNVAQTAEDEEYCFICSDDLPEELVNLDEMIAEYEEDE